MLSLFYYRQFFEFGDWFWVDKLYCKYNFNLVHYRNKNNGLFYVLNEVIFICQFRFTDEVFGYYNGVAYSNVLFKNCHYNSEHIFLFII